MRFGSSSSGPEERTGAPPDDDTPVGRRFSAQGRRPAPDGGSNGPPKGTKRESGPLSFLKELPALLLIAFVLALLIKTFLMQAFFIPSESMLPTLDIGDRVLVNKVVYRLHPPRRGDVIVFEEPGAEAEPGGNPASAFFRWLTEGLGVSANPERDFIKRVVGLPGEVVELHVDETGRCRVFIDGRTIEEPYLPDADTSRCQYGPETVPPERLFVMGDNRDNSNDSRFGLGFVPYEKVVGRAFVVIWPPSHAGWLRGAVTSASAAALR